MSGWSTTNTTSAGSDKAVDFTKQIEVFKFPPKKEVRARSVGPIFSFVRYWITIVYKDKKTGKKVQTSVPKWCLDYDPVKGDFVRSICPYRKAFESGEYNYKVKGRDGRDKDVIQMDRKFIANFIIRDIQDNEPKKKPKHTRKELKETTILGHKHFWKEPGSESWTPCRAVLVTNTLAIKLKGLATKNTRKVKGEKKAFDLGHPKYGMDINLSFDPDAQGAAMYDATLIMPDEDDPSSNPRVPLTEEEMGLLLQNIDVMKPEELDVAKKECKQLLEKIAPDPAGSKSSSKSKGKAKDDDEDDDDLDEDDLDDEDDEDAPRSKKSSKSKKTAKSSKTDKKSSKVKAKAKSKDDDDDDDLDDDLEDLKINSKSSKSKDKAKSNVTKFPAKDKAKDKTSSTKVKSKDKSGKVKKKRAA